MALPIAGSDIATARDQTPFLFGKPDFDDVFDREFAVKLLKAI